MPHWTWDGAGWCHVAVAGAGPAPRGVPHYIPVVTTSRPCNRRSAAPQAQCRLAAASSKCPDITTIHTVTQDQKHYNRQSPHPSHHTAMPNMLTGSQPPGRHHRSPGAPAPATVPVGSAPGTCVLDTAPSANRMTLTSRSRSTSSGGYPHHRRPSSAILGQPYGLEPRQLNHNHQAAPPPFARPPGAVGPPPGMCRTSWTPPRPRTGRP